MPIGLHFFAALEKNSSSSPARFRLLFADEVLRLVTFLAETRRFIWSSSSTCLLGVGEEQADDDDEKETEDGPDIR
jgi:hypothetical protein